MSTIGVLQSSSISSCHPEIKRVGDCEYEEVLARTLIEVIYNVLDECTQLFKDGQGANAMPSSREKKLTSAVQDPELDGWKKLSTVAINLARLSNALEPARYVFVFPCTPLPNGAER